MQYDSGPWAVVLLESGKPNCHPSAARLIPYNSCVKGSKLWVGKPRPITGMQVAVEIHLRYESLANPR